MYSRYIGFILPILFLFLFMVPAFLQVKGEGINFNKNLSSAVLEETRTQLLFKVDTGGGILPLHNFTLSVTLKENTVYLKWVAENEMNTEKFVIERSTDGTTFRLMGNVPPTGPLNILTEYNTTDDIQGINSGVAYYRIKAEDNRGNFAYSNVVPVRLSRADGFSFWPNPFSASLNLSYNATVSASIRVEMYDNGGRLVIQQQFNINRGMNQLSITGAGNLSHGLYHVRIIDLMTNGVSFAKMAK